LSKSFPFFSIIVPTLNSSKTVGKCLDSILSQSFQNFEVLIIDGLSIDATLRIIKKYHDNRIRIYSEEDQGIYDAMNKGLELAQGQWLYFLGSDDVLFNTFVLEKISEKIIKLQIPVVYGNVLINGNSSWAKDGEVYGGEFSKFGLSERNICHQAIFYNRHFLTLHSLKFDLSYPISADWDLNLKCRKFSKFYFIDLIIAQFNSGGLSSFGKDDFPSLIKYNFPEMIRPYWQKRVLFYARNKIRFFINLKSFFLNFFHNV